MRNVVLTPENKIPQKLKSRVNFGIYASPIPNHNNVLYGIGITDTIDPDPVK